MKSILLVDDDDSVRGMIASALRFVGIPVVEATDREEAVRLYGQRPDAYVLVIMDVLMPGLDGFGALAEMKLINPRVRALFVSGTHELPGSGDSCVVDLVRKPFSTRKLVSRIQSFLSTALADTGSTAGAQISSAPHLAAALPRREGARQ